MLSLALTLCAVVALGAASSASAASVIGSSLTFNGSGAAQGGCTPRCTFIPTAVSGGNPVTSPIDGVIVRWSADSADAGNVTSTVRLRVIDSPALNQWVGVRSGPTQHTTAGFVTATFDLKPGVPIAAGDHVGVDTVRDDGSTNGAVLRGQLGSSFVRFLTPLPNGGAPQAGMPMGGFEVFMQAIVEPDADNDGFGDETQDLCPSNATIQGACPAPASTTSSKKRKCKKKKKKRSAESAKKKRCKKKRKKH
jgi:hypothetical protein